MYKDELENDTEIFTRKTFDKIDIVRGAPKPKKGLLGSLFKSSPPAKAQVGMDVKPVGFFKGKIEIYD